MSGRRREFLGWLGASTLLAVVGRGVNAQQGDGSRVADPGRAPVSDEWDVSWVERIRGDARAVFDVPTPGEGEGIWRAGRWREDYEEVYGARPGEPTPVLVIRHKAIQFVMDNEYWKRFEVGKRLEIERDGEKGWVDANPVSLAHGGTVTEWDRYTLQSFMARGGIVLACNLAFRSRVVGDYRERDHLDRAEAEARAREHILPGVILQPSGIFAVLRAQQAGCAYILAS